MNVRALRSALVMVCLVAGATLTGSGPGARAADPEVGWFGTVTVTDERTLSGGSLRETATYELYGDIDAIGTGSDGTTISWAQPASWDASYELHQSGGFCSDGETPFTLDVVGEGHGDTHLMWSIAFNDADRTQYKVAPAGGLPDTFTVTRDSSCGVHETQQVGPALADPNIDGVEWRVASVPLAVSLFGSSTLAENGRTITVSWALTHGLDVGTIVIEKSTDPAGSLVDFTFTGAVAGTIRDGGSLRAVVPIGGPYTVTELPTAGWSLFSISCDDNDSFGSASTGSVTIQVASTEIVTCDFVNKPTPDACADLEAVVAFLLAQIPALQVQVLTYQRALDEYLASTRRGAVKLNRDHLRELQMLLLNAKLDLLSLQHQLEEAEAQLVACREGA